MKKTDFLFIMLLLKSCINSIPNSSDRNQLSNKTCFTTNSIDNQVISVKVVDTTCFINKYKTLDTVGIGSDIFLFHCSDCHGNKPNLCKQIDCDKYSNSDNLSLFLVSKNHKRNGLKITNKLNDYEIKFIASYLNNDMKISN